jgi:hypothetical protein
MSEPRSVAITTLDAARQLDACLESAIWANEIVVVDSHSRDDTAAARGWVIVNQMSSAPSSVRWAGAVDLLRKILPRALGA